MNHNHYKYVTLSVFLLLASGSFAAPPQVQTGASVEMTFDGLTRVDHTRFDDVWIRTGMDLSQYNKVIFEATEIAYLPVKRNTTFPLTDAQKTRLAEELNNAFISELGNSNVFQLVTSTGPGVLLLRASLQDVESNVPPEPAGRYDVYISEVGRAKLVLELYDSETNTILARAIDKQVVNDASKRFIKADSVTTWQEVKQVGKMWASAARNGLETLITK